MKQKRDTTPPTAVSVQPTHTNPANPTILIDGIELALREDDLCFLRLIINLPEGKFEQGKFFLTRSLLKRFIEDASKALDHISENNKPEETAKE